MPSFRLHSKYNPHKEAQLFADTIEGFPSIIVITEPGESYLAPVLKAAFPCAKRIAVRYTDDLFTDSDRLWDAVWRPKSGSLPFFLVAHVPDEKLSATRFLSWKAADKAFPDAAVTVWKGIRAAIDLLTSVMHTRSFFGKKWLQNTVYNAVRVEYPAAVSFGTQDFILAGAGPSLDELTAGQAAPYSIVAVTSAYRPLAARHITPALCIGTDAGYWALRLFDGMDRDVPIAFPLEAAVPAAIMERNPCIALSYGSPLEIAVCSAVGLRPLAARENGTVTGTACELLLTHTDRRIVLAGVDLAAGQGFSHAQSHSSMARVCAAADRMHPLAGMLVAQNFQTKSLEAYRQWFLQLPPEAAVRLSRAGRGGASIPTIKRVQLPENHLPDGRQQHGCTGCSTLGSPVAGIRGAAGLSVQPYRVLPRKERIPAVRALLTAVRSSVTQLIAADPARLADDAPGIEKQVCALCSYTAYCNVVKDSANRELQQKLQEQVDRTLGMLIERIDV